MTDLLGYINENFQIGEPIFLSEIPEKNEDVKRQKMKKLVDDGSLNRLYNGVYFRNYVNAFGEEGNISFERLIEKRFISREGRIFGYVTGYALVNEAGLTTQVPPVLEIASNKASTAQRKIELAGRKAIIYKPVVEINGENVSSLRFLDLMACIDKYAEFQTEGQNVLKRFTKETNVDFDLVKRYIGLYPDKTYRNIYDWGMMNELV